MKVLRTPESRFENLKDYPYKPNYIEVDNLRMHYVDEGKNKDEVVLMLHGEPTWSYLYRKMIKIVVDAGYRVVAPDMIGFGKSDKPSEKSDYTYQGHVDWMTGFVKNMDLDNITLVCQDWGGIIGLRVAAENSGRFKRITASNTWLPTTDFKMPEAFFKWQTFSKTTTAFPAGPIVNGGSRRTLSPEEIAAYDAPFPDDTYKAGPWIFPSLVPTTPDDPAIPACHKAWEVFSKWEKPFLTAFGDSDPITAGNDLYFQKMIPGAKGQKHRVLKDASHFVQEDKGEEWADIIVEFIKEN